MAGLGESRNRTIGCLLLGSCYLLSGCGLTVLKPELFLAGVCIAVSLMTGSRRDRVFDMSTRRPVASLVALSLMVFTCAGLTILTAHRHSAGGLKTSSGWLVGGIFGGATLIIGLWNACRLDRRRDATADSSLSALGSAAKPDHGAAPPYQWR